MDALAILFKVSMKTWGLFLFGRLRVRLDGGVKKWNDGKYLVFSLVCLVGGVKKWEDGKLFCLVGEKNGRMKNVIYINWLLYHYYIICKNRFIYTYYIILNLSHHMYKFILL